jgi:hypothetical protein
VKLRSRLFTALNLLPSIATLAFTSRPITRHSSTKRAYLADRTAVVLPEIGDRLVVGDEPAKQPHQLDIAAGLALEPPARLHPVEIAVDVELQQIGGRIARAACVTFGSTPVKKAADRSSPSTKASIKRTGLSGPT